VAASNYLKNKLVDHIFRAKEFIAPDVMYVGLLRSLPYDGQVEVELCGHSYARVPVVSSMDAWSGTQDRGSASQSTGDSGATSNNLPIRFPVPTADWGEVRGFALYDSQVGGNMIIFGELTTSKFISFGEHPPVFVPGALMYQLKS